MVLVMHIMTVPGLEVTGFIRLRRFASGEIGGWWYWAAGGGGFRRLTVRGETAGAAGRTRAGTVGERASDHGGVGGVGGGWRGSRCGGEVGKVEAWRGFDGAALAAFCRQMVAGSDEEGEGGFNGVLGEENWFSLLLPSEHKLLLFCHCGALRGICWAFAHKAV